MIIALNSLLYKRSNEYLFPKIVGNSCYFNGVNSSLYRLPSSVGNRKKWTFATWIQPTGTGNFCIFSSTPDANNISALYILNGVLQYVDIIGGSVVTQLTSDKVLLDQTAPVHLQFNYDTTVTTPGSSNIYFTLNGNKLDDTQFSVKTYPPQNTESFFSSTSPMVLGSSGGGALFFNGFMTETCFIDGYNIYANSFTQTSTTIYDRVPKDLTALSSAGTNGFYFQFASSSNMGANTFGADYTVLNSVDQSLNTPTCKYDRFNGLIPNVSTLSNGNLTTSASYAEGCFSYSIEKVAWKFSATSSGSVGIKSSAGVETTITVDSASSYEFFLDAYLGKLQYKKDGGSLTTVASNLVGPFKIISYSAGTLETEITPSEVLYNPCASLYLYTPKVKSGVKDFCQTAAYATGSSVTINSYIEDLQDKEFLLLLKPAVDGQNTILIDSVRGFTKSISSSSNGGESTVSEITVTGSSISIPASVLSTGTYYLVYIFVVSSNNFSICKYTGTGTAHTIPHTLKRAPFLMLCKELNPTTTKDWSVYCKSVGASKSLHLNTTAAASTSSAWNSTDPTNSVFSVGASSETNTSGKEYIIYMWADSDVYSPICFTGNGSSSGVFVPSKFKNYLQMFLKNSENSSTGWGATFKNTVVNPIPGILSLDSTSFIGSVAPFISVSNGFKILSDSSYINELNKKIIGLSVLYTPTKYATGF